MNEIDQKDVMDARKWIEFGKMWNNIAVEGWEVVLESDNDDEGNMTYNVSLFPCGTERPFDVMDELSAYSTPYEAMKRMYFAYFLDQPDGEDVKFDLPPEMEAELYVQADKEGITIDEVVVNILKQMIQHHEEDEKVQEIEVPEIGISKCCYNCVHLKRGSQTICLFHNYPTEREYTCKNFYIIE